MAKRDPKQVLLLAILGVFLMAVLAIFGMVLVISQPSTGVMPVQAENLAGESFNALNWQSESSGTLTLYDQKIRVGYKAGSLSLYVLGEGIESIRLNSVTSQREEGYWSLDGQVIVVQVDHIVGTAAFQFPDRTITIPLE
ncbi:hypothetical protein GOV11_03740 [Candidatus Woesearchaeota archaeon]|nr:hypothetical protein [Candidatus Woesearchaeota archaeon]